MINLQSQSILPAIEVGAYDIDSAIAAQNGGADRVELCANLPQGGISPSAGVIKVVRASITIGLWVMIRPRPYDFCYSDSEFSAMAADIEVAKKLGANGVVFGLLNPNGDVDSARTRLLVQAAYPMQVTFHRAFDVSRNLSESLETLVELGVHRILTTGGNNNSLHAMDVIAGLVKQAGTRIGVMVARTDETTVKQVIEGCCAKELHINARHNQQSKMTYRKPEVLMGAKGENDYAWPVTSADRIAQAVHIARSCFR